MKIETIDFLGSFPSVSQCPKEERPEYAMIGRSNVGKSSLINTLTGRKGLARISNKPGKTQLLNFYLINSAWCVVDLPGYGYAKISKRKRKDWERMIEGYLMKRFNLQCAMVLIDSNVSPQKIDIDFINWLGERQIPFVLVYTKADKSKSAEIEANLQHFRTELKKFWNELPQEFITSSREGKGTEELLDFIAHVNTQFQPFE